MTVLDIEDILYTCGFSTASYNAASATNLAQSISVDATRPTDISQLTTTIIGGAAGGSGSNDRGSDSQPTATQGGSNSNNDDGTSATATGDAAKASETNAAPGVAPFGVAGVVIAGAFMMVV